jgi:threonine synthase
VAAGSFVTHLSCPRCGRTHHHRRPASTCSCGGPLLVEYDLERVGAVFDPADVGSRPPTTWRFHELLPLDRPEAAVTLGEGFTPLVAVPGPGRSIGLPSLWVKDEGRNPTGTFKARGAACGISRAVELGVRRVALATAGNAGEAWAVYGAAAGLPILVAMPSDAPRVNVEGCRRAGAELVLVEGTIADAGRVVADRAGEEGWFDASTLREPYRIEGKKTLGLEIAEQFGWEPPDAIVYPAGGGVGLIGMWRAFEQLRAIGLVRGEGPRLIVTQAAGCAPLVKAFAEGRQESDPWPDPVTVAAGLRVPKALGDFLVLRAVRETGGTCIAVTDEEILSAVARFEEAGISAGPEGAATLAAAVALRDRGDLRASDRVVLVNTGAGT